MLLFCQLFRCVTNINPTFTVRKMSRDCPCENFTASPLCLCRICCVIVYYDVTSVILITQNKYLDDGCNEDLLALQNI
ncbi:uncharacterized protein Smp_202990 [Schistosoma mansoni]|uniref:Smp_202990 n=1 Tax=Schistosoma mansoni TaxID=6183 RepID=G4VM09_SCHMA|nr:uncharacterized protein Smp_202990 [Schistosoma mansoni]|eukprot:XP_018653113.1 uncharacterized protein Smp_202990 [Schistosoma mansoni]